MSISVPSAWHEASLHAQEPIHVFIFKTVGCKIREENILSPVVPSRKSMKLSARWQPFLNELFVAFRYFSVVGKAFLADPKACPKMK